MGDFVKGHLDPSLPPGFRRGILQHRQLDRYAQDASAFRRSKRRLADTFGHCKGVMVDIFYDHFLARHWERFSPITLEIFAEQIYQRLQHDFARLPPGLQQVAPLMIRHNWLVSYRDITTVGRVLARLSARLGRENRLAEGLPELTRNYDGLAEDFFSFLVSAESHMRSDAGATTKASDKMVE